MRRAMAVILLLVPCLAAIAVPLFNRSDPVLFGFPFFYWLQLVLIPVSSLFIYWASRREGP